MNPKTRSFTSLAVLLVISLCAIASMDYSHITSETTPLGEGVFRTEYRGGDPEEVRLTVEGPQNFLGQHHGDDVKIIGDNYRIIGSFENGLRHGEFVYYDEADQPLGITETYAQGILVPGIPETSLPVDRGVVYQLIARDRPWFLFQAEMAGISGEDLDAFLEELRLGLVEAKPRNRNDFALYLGLLLSNLETTSPEAVDFYRCFASIEAQTHVKAFPLRRAVIEFYQTPGSDLYGILAASYPGFLADLGAYLPKGTGPKAFIDAIEAALLNQESPDPQDPAFLTQIDAVIQAATAELDPEQNFRLTVALPFLLGEMGAEVDPVYQALFEAVPFTGPLILVGESRGLPVTTAIFDAVTGKSLDLKSKRAAKVNAIVEVSNQGNLPETLLVRGANGDRFFDVSYQGPAGNVTAAVNSGRYQTPVLSETSAAISIRMEVTPNRRLLEKSSVRRLVYLQKKIALTMRAASTSDAAIIDAATVRVETQREVIRLQPTAPPAPVRPRGPGM